MIVTRCSGRPELPVGKIVCVGRNYADHAKEMSSPAEPILFLKPSTALHLGGGAVRLPPWSREIHHEVEMVIRVGRAAKDVRAEEAGDIVDACAVGLDLTARDLQSEAKKRGEPWSVAKGFDGAAPLSELAAVRDAAMLGDLEVSLQVGGELRQRGRTSQMIWSVPALLAFASSRFRLEPGDLVFTGTPSGVGPVRPGDRLVATLGTVARLELDIAR